ncbi:MAG: hypothetical protein Q8Q89_04015 [bacterium]|nr:hypothetical protein [bacterium]
MTAKEYSDLGIGKSCPYCSRLYTEKEFNCVGDNKDVGYLIESWWGNFHYTLYMQCPCGKIATYRELGIHQITALSENTVH